MTIDKEDTDYDFIDYDIEAGCAEIVLDRPDVLNAFHAEMIQELVLALMDAQSNDRVYSIFLTGKGRGFCSGADISNLSDDEGDPLTSAEHLWHVQNVVRYLYQGSKPSVAAVNGPALGAGCDFALACDLRVMEEDAYLREQFVNIGLVPGDGGGWLLPRLVGESKAKEYILTGKDITPQAAEELGLVVEVVDSGESYEVARKLADQLRDKPFKAVRNCKDLIDMNQSFEEYAQAAIAAQREAISHSEQTEAIRAIQEGRSPDYDREY